jgi:TPP-dependent pyruvate/acetoin dehydrogenase alpha subunit
MQDTRSLVIQRHSLSSELAPSELTSVTASSVGGKVPAMLNSNFSAIHLGLEFPLVQRLYFQMYLIRIFETLLLELFSQNKLFGTTHTCLGQEANAVAVMEVIDRSRDMIFSNHRCHGHFLAYCGQVAKLLAEIMGKPAGLCGGRGGSQHLHWHNFMSNGIQGGLVPSALGAAKAEMDTGALSVVFVGDGTMGEGVLYECLNLAALWSLPVLFVVEDNGIAQTTPRNLGVSGSIARRAEPFGIRSFMLDTSDATEIVPVANEATDYVRSEKKPAWLYLTCARLGPHSKGDDLRPKGELDILNRRDPLAILKPRIQNPQMLEKRAQALLDEALRQIEDAV